MIIGWEYELSSNVNHFCVEDEITFSRESSVLHFSTKHYSPQADTHIEIIVITESDLDFVGKIMLVFR